MIDFSGITNEQLRDGIAAKEREKSEIMCWIRAAETEMKKREKDEVAAIVEKLTPEQRREMMRVLRDA